MRYVLLCLSKACNLNCIGCSGEKTGYISTKKDIPVIIKTLLKIHKENGIERIVLHGAETFILNSNDLQAILGTIRETFGYNMQISCQSNGTLITNEKLEIFKKFNIDISLSYRGDKELFKMLTQTDNDDYFEQYKKSFEKVKKYMNNKLNSIFYYPTELEDYIIKNYKKIIDYAVELGINNLVINEYASSNPNKKYYEFVIKCQEYIIKQNYPIILGPIYNILNMLHGKKQMDCSWRHNCLNFISIDPDGSLHICNRKIKRYKTVYKECKTCPIFLWCNGGCEYVRELQKDRSFPYCEDRKKLIEYCLKYRLKLATYYYIKNDV